MKLLTRIQEKTSSWRLPVRIPVPNRDNLIAMGLMALSLGLMVGVAIGPALGAASNAVAGIVTPAATAPPVEAETATVGDDSAGAVELGSPAGSESVTSSTSADTSDSSDGGLGDTSSSDDSYADTDYSDTDVPADKNPAKDETEPDDEDDEEEEAEGTELKGAVINVDVDGTGYDIADSSGNVLALHAAEPPAPGAGVVTHIEPLANGTFAEVGTPKLAGLRPKSKLRGTATWVDPGAKLVVISSRGSSLAVDFSPIPDDPELVIEPGSPIEALVSIGEPVVSEDGLETRPGLVASTLEVSGESLESFDLHGVISATGSGATGRGLMVAADGNGLIPSEITIEAPKSFDPALVTPGETYNLSVERDSAGALQLTGLSPDYNKKVAGDSAAAFGTHA